MKKEFCFLGLVLLFFGYGVNSETLNEVEDINFLTAENQYAVGSTVTLKLNNSRNEKVGYNLCSSQLERKASGEWIAVEREIYCNAVLILLASGEVATYRFRLGSNASLKGGTYRFKTNVLIGGSSLTVFTDPFEVYKFRAY